jgi:acetoin:2,6-dichlorophenolindophenol oxidoreductase subunit alpha
VTAGADSQDLLGLYRWMLLIRFFEDRAEELFKHAAIRGGLHLANGQEAVSVGVCSVLEPSDTLTCTYRGHASVIAKGAPLDGLFGELLGKAHGVCRGKGGSMHLTDFGTGVLGSFAVVGAHLPISVGAALTARYKKTGAVAACFFGDGATNIGTFHEALNLSAVWKLPVVFVCENNLWGEYSPIGTTTSTEQLVERGASYGIWSRRVDGNDLLAVREVAKEAVAHARAGDGPAFIEAMTYRQKGHSARADAGRPPEEIVAWLERDPIRHFEAVLLADGHADVDELARLQAEAHADVDAALERAQGWPEPSPEELYEDILA